MLVNGYLCKIFIKNVSYVSSYFSNIANAILIDCKLWRIYNVDILQHEIQNVITDITNSEVQHWQPATIGDGILKHDEE